MASTSLGSRMPVAPSIAACARDPAMSCAAIRLSKPIEALIASMIASGPAEKRPPHIWLEALVDLEPSVSVIVLNPSEGK